MNNQLLKEKLKTELFKIYENNINKQIDCFISKVGYENTCYKTCSKYDICNRLRYKFSDIDIKENI